MFRKWNFCLTIHIGFRNTRGAGFSPYCCWRNAGFPEILLNFLQHEGTKRILKTGAGYSAVHPTRSVFAFGVPLACCSSSGMLDFLCSFANNICFMTGGLQFLSKQNNKHLYMRGLKSGLFLSIFILRT